MRGSHVGFASSKAIDIAHGTLGVGKFGEIDLFSLVYDGDIEVYLAASENIRVLMDLNGEHFEEIKVLEANQIFHFEFLNPEIILVEFSIQLAEITAHHPSIVGIFEVVYFEILDKRMKEWPNVLLDTSQWIASLEVRFLELESLLNQYYSPRHVRRQFEDVGISKQSLLAIRKWQNAQLNGNVFEYYDLSHFNRATKKITGMNPRAWNALAKNVRFVQLEQFR
jgi:hypothetical protein